VGRKASEHWTFRPVRDEIMICRLDFYPHSVPDSTFIIVGSRIRALNGVEAPHSGESEGRN
jgi:hypothetical protein